ncbi:MAG: hypothetical protein O2923_12915 [Verrucomicrobia bacterium]|nr:hypothetical protein [Verrucomicrobiota bacterium]MDA1085803.1 hypothetical protein [Verrucomicrobiota bacterium]
MDALGRAWLQTRERLLVVEKDETLLERPMGQPGYGLRFRHPCEWQPGCVFLFYASDAVWATPDAVTVRAPPSFADDGTGTGPFRMGTNLLVAGACNNNGMLVAIYPHEAVLLTPVMGLPLPKVEHMAVVGDDLIMAGDRKIVVWQTTEPLPAAAGLDERREWLLSST